MQHRTKAHWRRSHSPTPSLAALIGAAAFGGAVSITSTANATVFTMTPDDDWSILEAAQAGDVVEIEPGTYRFRVYLDKVGTADQPIILRAKDPDNRPVWDLVGDGDDTLVDTWPGSYGAGDNHRGCWQVASEGAYYQIEGIVFQNCRAPSSAGVRMINSGPVTLRDCTFQYNTNGLTGASTDLVVEHSEFFQNGKTITSGPATHHIYIFGGKFTLRYSYLHDGHEGQAFHIRARESTIEYNWITRPANYVGDIMSCEQFCGDAPHSQSMLVQGNVIVQGTPSNGSQLFALFRDADEDPAASMHLTLVHNTIIGTPRSGTHNLVNLRNDTVSTYLSVYNNIIYDVGTLAEAADPSASNWGVEGAGNWLSDGTVATDTLTASVFGDDPGFADRDGSDFTLITGAAAIGGAVDSAPFTPDREYYLDEDVSKAWRPRATAFDIGAFESDNDSQPVGAYDEAPVPPVDPPLLDGGAPASPDASRPAPSEPSPSRSDGGGPTAPGNDRPAEPSSGGSDDDVPGSTATESPSATQPPSTPRADAASSDDQGSTGVGSPSGDGGASDVDSSGASSDSCECRLPTNATRKATPLWFALAALAALTRRRRRN